MSNHNRIIKKIKICSGNIDSITRSSAKVIQEIMLTVKINGEPLANIACAGTHLEELTAGFLRSERIISRKSEIASIKINNNKSCANVILKSIKNIPVASIKNISSSGARGKTNIGLLKPLNIPVDLSLKTSLVLKLMDELLNGSAVHNQTGGTHCSALAVGKKIVALREDIGRHNTIDMLSGYALLQKKMLNRAIILTTGRISSEIVYKIWNMGMPVIISHSAPTANAVALSKKANILLIGYVRNGQMTIYSHERRVKI